MPFLWIIGLIALMVVPTWFFWVCAIICTIWFAILVSNFSDGAVSAFFAMVFVWGVLFVIRMALSHIAWV